MRRKLFVILLSFTLLQVNAQVKDVNTNETGEDYDTEMPESMRSNIESQYNIWLKKNLISFENDCMSTNKSPVVADSLIIDRLSRIPTVIEMPFNEEVKKYITRYANSLRTKVSFMLGASNLYVPTFEKALDLYNLPIELKYLPVIESALDPLAVSRQGATGLWQFMLTTGKKYGLKHNSLIDERRDPIKSTWAAVNYLKDLYDIYNDWNLVLAAYNSGPGTVNKAIQRAGGVKDYWKICKFLPKETRGYVPAFIAANYIMTYYCEHGICPMTNELPETTDTIQINRDLHFSQVAEVCKVDIEELKVLNPQYKKDLIPGNSFACSLSLPSQNVALFVNNEKTIFDYKSDELFTKRREVEVDKSETKTTHSSLRKAKVRHKVRRGETLGTIADKYGVSVSKLKKLNHIRGTKITAGKTLKIR